MVSSIGELKPNASLFSRYRVISQKQSESFPLLFLSKIIHALREFKDSMDY